MKAIAIVVGMLAMVGCAAEASQPDVVREENASAAAASCSGLSIQDVNPAAPVGRCSGGFALVGFSEAEESAVRGSLAGWNDFAGRGLVHITDAGSCSIVAGDHTSQVDGVITLDTSALTTHDPAFFRFVVMHEVGRAMGMKPTSTGRGIMSTCTTDPWFTSDEKSECAKLGLCSQ